MSAPDLFAEVQNPFNAPIYYKDEVESTMDEARAIDAAAEGGAAHGTVIAAGYQSAGRGRGSRSWKMNKGESLPFTVILKYSAIEKIPPCLTLRAGLAVADGIENFACAAGASIETSLKWPNDVMIADANGAWKKAAGILTEAFSDLPLTKAQRAQREYLATVCIGIGVNFAQREFPPDIADKAISIYRALTPCSPPPPRPPCELLEKILFSLYSELSLTDWKERIEEKLYLRGKSVRFVPGAPDGGEEVRGILCGISDAGEIVIAVGGEARAFPTGELKVY